MLEAKKPLNNGPKSSMDQLTLNKMLPKETGLNQLAMFTERSMDELRILLNGIDDCNYIILGSYSYPPKITIHLYEDRKDKYDYEYETATGYFVPTSRSAIELLQAERKRLDALRGK